MRRSAPNGRATTNEPTRRHFIGHVLSRSATKPVRASPAATHVPSDLERARRMHRNAEHLHIMIKITHASLEQLHDRIGLMHADVDTLHKRLRELHAILRSVR